MIETVLAMPSAELLKAVPEVRRVERESMASMLAHLAVVDARQLYAELGFSSMYRYLTQGLGYSEEEACRRLRVARLLHRFPQVHAALADGRLHLTSASLLSREMTAENADTLIDLAAGRTKRSVEVMLADLRPKPDAPTSVRKLPEPAVATEVPSLFEPISARKCYPSQDGRPPAPKPRPPTTTPLGRARYSVRFTASEALVGKLERLGALMSHTCAPSDLPALVEQAVDLAIEHHEKRRFGQRKRTVASKKASANTRYIPTNVRREVYERDQGRCTYSATDGRRCEGRHRLQFDHILPFAMGGASTADNLRLRCQTHNLLEARRVFGPNLAPTFELSG